MFVAVFFVFLLCQISAEPVPVKYRCNDTSSDVTYTTFSPSFDGVKGRYTAELCTLNRPYYTNLTMDLTFNDNMTLCTTDYPKKYIRARRPGPQHSSNTIDITGVTNCTHVCYSMDFDLIFSSCYQLQSTFKKDKTSYAPYNSYHLISNNITKEYYDNNSAHVNFVNHDEEVSLYWFLGRIPAVEFNVTLYRVNNSTGDPLDHGQVVTQNCTMMYNVREVHCILAPAYGCYQASLEHGGLWTTGTFSNFKFVHYNFCHQAAPPVRVRVRSAALWWLCGAALLALAGLLVAALHRVLRQRSYHKVMLEAMLRNRFSEVERVEGVERAGGMEGAERVEGAERAEGAEHAEGVERAEGAERDSRDVLLLYAREGEHGELAVRALKDLIQHSTGGTVYDLFSPEVMAQCAAAPHSWLRDVLLRPHVRVLLLQSPATALLYHAPLCQHDAGLRLRSPLLPRRAVYRSPQFGDTLLQLALRLVAETVELHHDYQKYYLATYSELQTDVVPQVVPYRRYELPGAARALAADLSGREPAPPRLHALRAAALRLLRHVRDHPAYLLDELVVA